MLNVRNVVNKVGNYVELDEGVLVVHLCVNSCSGCCGRRPFDERGSVPVGRLYENS